MTLHRCCLLTALALVAGCSHARKEVKAEAPAPGPLVAVAPQQPKPEPGPAPARERTCTADEQCGGNELCVSSNCVEITAGLAECRNPSVHFDFDRADLHPDDLPTLQRAARCLRALTGERTLVEGNCDERGTVEYNLALGLRRAHSVTKYLEDLGVQAARLSAVSYGKELPICTVSAESCWALNRRADVSRGKEPKDVTAMIRADRRRERGATTEPAHAVAAARSARARRSATRETPAAVESPATKMK